MYYYMCIPALLHCISLYVALHCICPIRVTFFIACACYIALHDIACACYIALHDIACACYIALHVPVCHCMCLLYCTTCSATCTYLALHVPVRAAACVYYHFIHAVELHRLLHWRNNEERLPSILTLVTKVPGDEIVKVRLYTVRVS